MKRIPVLFLVVAFSTLWASTLISQAPGTPAPGTGRATGAAAPGMPAAPDNGGPQTGTARIRGRVVAAESGLPLQRVQVALLPFQGTVRRSASTDSEGRFEFTGVPAGRFAVSATKAGYVQVQYGQRRPFEPGTPVNVADDESVERIDFALTKGSVIVVRVTDDLGEPLVGAQVQLQRFQYGQDGQRRPVTVQSGVPGPFMTVTDDRGELRAFGLMPGEYVVSATVRNFNIPGSASEDARDGFSPTFYPGTASLAEAQAVSIGTGEERSIQFAMTPARLARISGTVTNSAGLPAAGAQVMLMTRQGNGGSSSGGGTVAADGTFTISGVAPGEHSVDVRPPFRPGESGGEFASMPVAVSGSDITGLRIVTGKGVTISGRVIYEGTAKRDAPPVEPRVLATPIDRSGPSFFGGDPRTNGVIGENGTFKVTAGSGRVFLNVVTPPSWVVKSITFEGEDIVDQPFDLTGRQSVTDVVIRLTDKMAQISGRVSDGRGQLQRDYVVIIQPADAKEPLVASRLTRLARPDTSGRFELRGLRPGRYVATAIETLEQGRQFAPEFREQLRRSAREFAVRDGETVALDLTLTTGL